MGMLPFVTLASVTLVGRTGRPENKNLLIASGCFGMILTGFMSKNTPYNCKIKGARAHINNCIGRISFVLQKPGREGD